MYLQIVSWKEGWQTMSPPGQQSDIVLVARSKEALEATKAEIEVSAAGIRVHLIPCDLGDIDHLPTVCKEILSIADSATHSQYVLIHNAGTMNTFDKPFEAFSDPKEIQDYFAINYTSMAVLTAQFLSAIASSHQCWVVNITSLLATAYIPGFSLYTPAKAARNAYMGVLTAEKPNIRTLNYSPGPCLTNMLASIPKELTDKFDDKITCQESITKFVCILKEDHFENGALIDFYD